MKRGVHNEMGKHVLGRKRKIMMLFKCGMDVIQNSSVIKKANVDGELVKQ